MPRNKEAVNIQANVSKELMAVMIDAMAKIKVFSKQQFIVRAIEFFSKAIERNEITK